jgi:hypothetical protein
MPHHRGAHTPFLSSASGWQSGCILFGVGVRQKENDNDANRTVRDCLAQSETTYTSATLGADHSGFSNEPLFGSRIDFHLGGIVLGHDI